MDALMAALVAAVLAQVGDRPAWLAAILADRYHAPWTIVASAALALAVASGIAAVGGAAIAPMLTPNARALLLALALILQGGGAVLATKPPERLDRWTVGAAGTATLGLFVLVFGDGLQFVVVALAARGSAPAMAAVGATLGSLPVIAVAATMGEAGWTSMPLVAARRVIGASFVLVGIAVALGALRLI